MADPDLDAVRARADAATDGPWWPRYGGEPGYIYASASLTLIAEVTGEASDAAPRPNSTFIAHARTDIPALLNALTAARAQVDDLTFNVRRFEEWSNTLAGHTTDAYDDDGSQETCIDRWLTDLTLGARALLAGDPRGLLLIRHALTDDTPTDHEWDAMDALRHPKDGAQ